MTHAQPQQMIALDQIIIDPYFQFRTFDTTHATDLAATLRQTERALDPVIVWQTDAGLTLLDGLHRITAYRSVRWFNEIPAIIRPDIDRRTALAEALGVNAKRSLQMDQEARLNAAWRLVREPVEPRYKVKEIANLSGVGGRTIDNMRLRFKTIAPDEITGSWWRDRTDRTNTNNFEKMEDHMRQEAISNLALDIRDQLDGRKHQDKPILRDRQAVDEALIEALGDARMRALIDFYCGGEEGYQIRGEIRQAITGVMDQDSPF